MSDDFDDYLMRWQRLGDLLGLQVEGLESSKLGINLGLDRVVVLRGFGNKNGMILLPSGHSILPFCEQILQAGFGFSVLQSPNVQFLDELASFKEMLADWGEVTDET